MVRITYELFFFDQNFSFLDNFYAILLIVSSINKLIEIVQIVVVDNLHFESFHKKTHQNDRHFHKPGKKRNFIRDRRTETEKDGY